MNLDAAVRAFLSWKTGVALLSVWIVLMALLTHADIDSPRVKTETLTCVRVAQMSQAEPLKYICEVRK